MKKSALSVVVATHQRPVSVQRCLKSLTNQATQVLFEVVVVDNGAEKDCRYVVAAFRDKLYKLKYIKINKVGLANARNVGFRKAEGDYVAYIDDDSVADKNWVTCIYDFIKRNPEVNAFGGPYKRLYSKRLPKWFPPNYGELDLGIKEKKIEIGKEFLSGTNMVFKKSLLEKFGGFDTKLGMKGRQVAYGEEVDLQLRVTLKGVVIYYVPKLIVSHEFSLKKINFLWMISDYFQRGNAKGTINRRYADKIVKMYDKKNSTNRNLNIRRDSAGALLFDVLSSFCYLLGRTVGEYL